MIFSRRALNRDRSRPVPIFLNYKRFYQESSASLREFNLCVSQRCKGAKEWVNKSEIGG